MYRMACSLLVSCGRGIADLGRHIALNFSQLGYTVFALCPDRPQARSSSDADSSNVSSVRERSACSPLFPEPLIMFNCSW